jgi:hypothetical protein
VNAVGGDFSLTPGSPGKNTASDGKDVGIEYNSFLKKVWLQNAFTLPTQQKNNLTTNTSFTVSPNHYYQVWFYIPLTNPYMGVESFNIEGVTAELERDIATLVTNTEGDGAQYIQPGGPARWITLGRHRATDGTLNVSWSNPGSANAIFIRQIPTTDEAYSWISGAGSSNPAVSLQAVPPSISSGQSATLTWSSTNATSCSASGGWSGAKALSGSQSVSPTVTTTYTLSCSGASGSASAQATVTVSTSSGPSLAASPSTLAPGAQATVQVTNGPGNIGDWVGLYRTAAPAEDGSWTNLLDWKYLSNTQSYPAIPQTSATLTFAMPTTQDTYEFRLFQNDSFTFLAKSSPVTVSTAPADTTPPSTPTNLTATPVSQSQVNLSWSASTDNIGIENYKLFRNSTLIASPTETTYQDTGLTPATSYTYTVQAVDAAGNQSNQSAPARATTLSGATPAPEIPQSSLSIQSVSSEETVAEPSGAANVLDGNTATIWHTQWSGSQPSHPHQVTLALNTTYNVTGIRYTPRQDSQNGRIASYQVHTSTDNVTYILATQGTFTNGTSPEDATFTSRAARYVRLTATSEVNGGPWASAAELQVYGTAGTPTPTVTLSANPMSITQGQSATLTWSSTNATSCSASGGWSGAKALSGSQSVSPTVTTTYTLSCTNAGGTTSQSTTVTVTASTKFTIGQSVRVFTGGANLNVRATPNGTILGTQANGAQGTITGGPSLANSLWWWQVNFNSGVDGWAAEDYLVAASGALTPNLATTLNFTASRPSGQGSIAGVQWFLDNAPYNAEDTTSPYTLSLVASNLPAGSHSVFARFRMTSGATEETETFTFSAIGPLAAAQTPNQTLVLEPTAPTLTGDASTIGTSRESQIATITQALEAAKTALAKLLGQ